jgi:ABC-type glycerol-3-phosphate transport system substrate-binding protein
MTQIESARIFSRMVLSLVSLTLMALAACTGETANPDTVAATEVVTQEASATVVATVEVDANVMTPEPTPAGPRELVIWWPEPLAPLDNEDAADLLSEQLSAFQQENETIVIDFRLKQVGSVGGVMATLRSASAVAPGALPDVTLLRRNDLLIAAQNRLIFPLDEAQFPAVLEDLPSIGVELGTAENALYGLPYILNVQHMAYQVDDAPLAGWRFADLLEGDRGFIFPAARTSGINDVFLLQYLAAGGERLDLNQTAVNANALFDTLAFYEQALAAGVIDPSVLEYSTLADYQELWLTDRPAVPALVTSTAYLRLQGAGFDLDFGVVPSNDGQPVATVDGWMWVLTTSDAERQARAIQFLNWMLNAGRQGQYTRAVEMLPSQRTAIRQMSDADYATFISDLIANGTLPLTESESGATARVMQNALEEVILGTRTAEEATQDVLLQLDN